MPAVLIGTGRYNFAIILGSYIWYGSDHGSYAGVSETESWLARPMRVAGTYSKVSANFDAVGTARSIRLRKNSANANIVLSPADSTAGIVSSASTDHYAVADTFDIQLNGTAPAFSFAWLKGIFRADTGYAVHTSSGACTAGDTGNFWISLQGSTAFSTGSNVEDACRVVTRSSTTLSNLAATVAAATTSSATLTFRKNNANGNQTITISANTTGLFEDVTHNDSVVSGDGFNAQMSGHSANTSFRAGVLATYTGTSNDIVQMGWFNAAAGNQFPPLVGVYGSFTESDVALPHGFPGVASRLRCRVNTNSTSGSTVLTFRKNSADATQTLTIGAAATGNFEDTTHTDIFSSLDTCNFRLTPSGTGSLHAAPIGLTETPTENLDARFAGTGSLSVNTLKYKFGAATFLGAGSFSVAAGLGLDADIRFGGLGSLSADTIKYKFGAATFSGVGSLSVDTIKYKLGEITYGGLGSLSVNTRQYLSGYATFGGLGNLSAAARQSMVAQATFQGASDFSILITTAPKLFAATFPGVGNFQILGSMGQLAKPEIFGGVGNMMFSQALFKPLLPDADSIDGTWTDQSGGTNLFAAVDEMVTDDADYIKSVNNPVSDICKIGLSDPTVVPTSPFIVMYRYKKEIVGPAGQVDLGVRLLQGTTEIAAWTHTDIGGGFLTAEQTLTGPQFAAISNFNDLFIELNANAP